MSSNHRRKIARALAAKTGLTYQQALEAVITAAETSLLPHTLDKKGIERAAANLAASLPSARAVERDLLAEVLGLSHGLVVVTGLTGAGKTTTLYDCLDTLATNPGIWIRTVESPIERRLAAAITATPADNVSVFQHQYGSMGMTFESVHRNVRRFDPHVAMYSGIHLPEQIGAVTQSALTGTLTLVEMHAHSAAPVIERLIQGGEPFLVAEALRAVVVMEKSDAGTFTRRIVMINDATRDHIKARAQVDGDRAQTVDELIAELADLLADCPTQVCDLELHADDAARPTFASLPTRLKLESGPVGVGLSVSMHDLMESITAARETAAWTERGYDATVAAAIQDAMSASQGLVVFAGDMASGHESGLSTALDEQASRGRNVAVVEWDDDRHLRTSHPDVQHHYFKAEKEVAPLLSRTAQRADVTAFALPFDEGKAMVAAIADPHTLLATYQRTSGDDAFDALQGLHYGYGIPVQDIADNVTAVVFHHPSGDLSRTQVLTIDDDLRPVIAGYLGRGEHEATLLWRAASAATITGAIINSITTAERDTIRTGLRRLAAMAHIGMHYGEACTSLAEAMNGEPKRVFERLAAAHTFAAGVAKEKHVFEPWAITMIRNGEPGGLGPTLRELVEVF